MVVFKKIININNNEISFFCVAQLQNDVSKVFTTKNVMISDFIPQGVSGRNGKFLSMEAPGKIEY